MEHRMENLPPNYRDPEKAPVKFCIRCGKGVAFNEGNQRWGCNCGFVHHDYPQPVANVLLVVPYGSQKDQPSRPLNPNEEEAAVLIKRGVPPFVGKLALPGGFVNPREHPVKAAVREGVEEIGVRVALLRFLGSCHPNRYSINPLARFAHNNFSSTFLGVVREGTLTPGDDAQDLAIYGREELPESCFSSHNFMLQKWKEGCYPLSANFIGLEEGEEAESSASYRPEEINNCGRCSAHTTWDNKIERFKCSESQCKWVYWDSPRPHASAVLLDQGNRMILLEQGQSGLWQPPQDIIPAYCTPSEVMKKWMQEQAVNGALTHNVAATKLGAANDNRVDIVFGGAFDPNSLSEGTRLKAFELDALPEEMDSKSKAIVRGFQRGDHLLRGSTRT